MQLRSLGYQTDLALLQLGGTTVEHRRHHLVVRSPHNPLHRWGNFLLLDRVPSHESSESWLQQFAATFPDAEHVALGFDATAGNVHELDWFTHAGFIAEAQAVMTARDVHKSAHPNSDAVYRALHSDADWAASIELRMRCDEQEVDRMAYRRFVSAKADTNRGLVEMGHGAWFGAFIDDRLVSQMGLFSAGRELARFQSVETDPDYRRQGLAGSLVHHVSRYGFDVLGARTLVMVADPDYFAIDLYRAVGFTATETQLQIERGPGANRT